MNVRDSCSEKFTSTLSSKKTAFNYWFIFPDWQQFVHDKLQAWKQTNLDWLHNFTGPTHIIFYEQLVKNVENTLRTVLDFLEYPISDSLFQCAMARQEGIYRRKKKALTFNPFNGAMKKELNIEQEKVYNNIYNMASPVLNRKWCF